MEPLLLLLLLFILFFILDEPERTGYFLRRIWLGMTRPGETDIDELRDAQRAERTTGASYPGPFARLAVSVLAIAVVIGALSLVVFYGPDFLGASASTPSVLQEASATAPLHKA